MDAATASSSACTWSWRRSSRASIGIHAFCAWSRSLSSRRQLKPTAGAGTRTASRIQTPMTLLPGRDAVDEWFGQGGEFFLPARLLPHPNGRVAEEVRNARKFLFVLCKMREET